MSTFNPLSVMMGNPGNPLKPYVPTTAIRKTQQSQGSSTLAPESIRATGSGPFDPAYRQDLATFAGGLFKRPGGDLSFNPTSNQPFGGAAVGGGNAPLFGMPATLLQMALGGNPFSVTPPAPKDQAVNSKPNLPGMQWWLDRFGGQGRGLRMAE